MLNRLLAIALTLSAALASAQPADEAGKKIAPYFTPPPEFAGKMGDYRSPLTFEDGTPVKDAKDWPKRRAEIVAKWSALLGTWPEVIEKPKVEILQTTPEKDHTNYKVKVQVAPNQMLAGYLLVPQGKGPFPAVLVVFYDPETSIGVNAKGPFRDFAIQLTKRGFVTLSIGSPGGDAREPDRSGAVCQPLHYLGYVAANCANVLASRPEVDPKRIGVTGHSYGGKWAMFASAFNEKFAASAWSDPGIVFDEPRANVNYWEKWYLGLDPSLKEQRKPGLVTEKNPRTGAYKTMIEKGMDLHEVHALMAPRPFLVSGGSEDKPTRWIPLNHSIAVNKLLGYSDRVGMTNRPDHSPTADSNEILYSFFEHFLKNPKKE